MYFSVTFENSEGVTRNTWDDWHLIPTTPPMVDSPEPVYDYVDIPGSTDGPLDITGILSDGKPTFNNSEGSWQFYWIQQNLADTRPALLRSMRNFFTGEQMTVSFEEDPGYYRIGRFTVGEVAVGKDPTKVTIRYTIQPVEYEVEGE